MAGLAAGLAHRALGGGPRLGRHLHEREHGDATELHLSGGAVDEKNDARDLAARGLDEIDRLLDAPALGDDVFGDDVTLTLPDLEAAHGENGVGLTRGVYALALDLLGENALDVKFAGDLVTDEDSADGGGNDAVDALSELAALDGRARNLAAELFGDAREAKNVRALEIAVGMKFRAEFKMALEESARVFERLEYLVLRHFGFPFNR